MLSFVVENSTTSLNIYPKSPRHLVLNKLSGIFLVRLFLKHFNSSFFNSLASDSIWCYYRFFSYINRSTISLNLSITSYYIMMLMFFKKNGALPYSLNSTKYIFNQARMLTLPIYGHANNLTFIALLLQAFNSYPASYAMFMIKREYIFLPHTLQKYSNLNFYYLRIYAH